MSEKFDCNTFLTFQATKGDQSLDHQQQVTFKCNAEKSEEGFSLLEVINTQNNRVIIESRLYEQPEKPDPNLHADDPDHNPEDYENIQLDCFEVKSIFSSTSYNHFQCSPTPEDSLEGDNKKELKEQTLFDELIEQLEEQITHIKQKMGPQEEIGFDDIYKYLTLFKDGSNADLLELNDFEKVQIDGSLNTTLSSEDKQSFKMEGQDGIHFWFRFKEFPLVFLKCTIYKASDHYLRMIIVTNKQEFDLYISRYITEKIEEDPDKPVEETGELPKEKFLFLNAKYATQIIDILQDISGDTVVGPEQITGSQLKEQEESPYEIPEQSGALQEYRKSQLMSTPIAVMMLYDMISKAEGQDANLLSKTHLTYQFLNEIKPGESHNLETMNTLNWFLFTDSHYTPEKLKSLGALYEDLQIDEVREERAKDTGIEDHNQILDTPISNDDVINNINTFLTKYHQNHYNYFDVTIGLVEIMRKFVVKVYGYEDEFYKSVQVKFLTQYFAAEHIIPLSDYNSFYHELNKKFKEAIDHYQDYVMELEKVSIHQSEISVKDFKLIFNKFLDNQKFCLVDRDNKGFEIKLVLTDLKKPDFKDFQSPAECGSDSYEVKPITEEDAPDLPKCEDVAQGKARSVFKLDTGIGEKGKSIYILNIQEPQIEGRKKSSSTLLQFFKVYQYDYKPMLQKQLRSQVCHLLTGHYSRNKVDHDERHNIFTGGLDDGNN